MLDNNQVNMVNKLVRISEESRKEASNRLIQTWTSKDLVRVMGYIFPELTAIDSIELEKQIALSIYQ